MKKLMAMLLAILCILSSVGIMANAEDISAEPIVTDKVQDIPVDAKGMLISTGEESAGLFYYDVGAKKFFNLKFNADTMLYTEDINPYTGEKGILYADKYSDYVFSTAIRGSRGYKLICPNCGFMFTSGSNDFVHKVYNDPEAGSWPGRFRRHDKCNVDITEDDIWVEYIIIDTSGVGSVFRFSIKASEDSLENFKLKLAEHQSEVDALVAKNAQFYEEHKGDPAPQEPSKPWYQFIIDFFVSIANFFKNLFR